MIGKRQPVRFKGCGGNRVVSQPKPRRLTAREIEAELQRLAADDPKLDVQAVLADLRR